MCVHIESNQHRFDSNDAAERPVPQQRRPLSARPLFFFFFVVVFFRGVGERADVAGPWCFWFQKVWLIWLSQTLNPKP